MLLNVQQTANLSIPSRPPSPITWRPLTKKHPQKQRNRGYRRQMDTYVAHRETPSTSARSPPERSNWPPREDASRFNDRSDRPDTFYRGRSPSMF